MKLSKNLNHLYFRTLFLFDNETIAKNIFSDFLLYIKETKLHNPSGLIVTTEGSIQSYKFDKINQNLSNFNDVRLLSFNNVSTILGLTSDFLFIDLREEFNPNDICILFETVRGGGIIFVLGLSPQEWIHSVNSTQFFHENDTITKKSILLEWFLSNLQSVFAFNPNEFSIEDVIRQFNPLPVKNNLNSNLGNFNVTSDQKRVIENLLSALLNTEYKRSCSILLANRGRGKSAAVGITLSQMLLERKFKSTKVVISAPSLLNVKTLFQFISLGLTYNKINHKCFREKGIISEVKISNRIRLYYLPPSKIDKNIKSDLIVIDEAAAIPVETLREILKINSNLVLISTVHGYEGASRGFHYKIVNYLRNQQQIKLREFSLEQPIRYLQNDLVEQFLERVFLLNVELDPLSLTSQEIVTDSVSLKVHSNPAYLFSKKGISELRRLFGILIYAHYRNQPKDLLLIADSHTHFLVGLYGLNNENKTVLLISSQLAREGRMREKEIDKTDSGEYLEGNLIPNIAIRYFSRDFANLQGLRIVRLASHPDLIEKGYGRQILERILKDYDSYDWIGVSFGATVKLVKFWNKFGFKIVHIRPLKTSETGEWNVVTIHPISSSAKQIVFQASSNFQFQFISLLKQSLHSMKPELAIEILRSCNATSDYKPKITPSGYYRLKNYLKGNINILLAVDVIYDLAIAYFVVPAPFNLSSSQEALLVSRILQGRTWSQTLAQTGLKWKAANGLLEKAVNKIANFYS